MDHILERRIRFLIDAAKHEERRDQAITYVMRVLSNHAAIGKDGGSAEVKKMNRRVSKEAKKLLEQNDLNFYCRETINEHPKPLRVMWEWLKSNADHLSIQDVWSEFTSFPMVTITKIENERIRERGLQASGDIKSRYSDLGIQPIELTKPPKEY